MNLLQENIDQIKSLCDGHDVRSLFAFGSILTDEFNDESDIDLVVDIDNTDPLKYSENYFDFKFQLEALLKKPIDLLEEKALINPFLKQQINKTKMLVYGR